MVFRFEDVKMLAKKRDNETKKIAPVIPCVTCDSNGDTVDAAGDALSSLVSGEPNRVWATAYNDSIPFAVLNNNRVPFQSNLSVLVGYLEGSTEREILSLNADVLDLTAGWDDFSPYSSTTPAYVSRSSFPILKTTPAGTLNVAVSALEYDRFGQRAAVFSSSLDLSGCTPAGNKILYVLVYLDAVTGTIASLCGVSVPYNVTAIPLKPDTPVDGIASAYVLLQSTDTVIDSSMIVEAKRITMPNMIPGMVYNYIVGSVEVPVDYTYARGETHITAGQYIRIAQGGRMVIG